MKHSLSKIRWRYAVSVGIFIALLSVFPHFTLRYERGSDYNGATFFYDYDEVAHASYLQALIDGRPRRNSAYSGAAEPQKYETSFTIQFLAPYLVAVPARFFGVSADTAFLFASAILTFLTSLTLFALLQTITGNAAFSAAATVFILLFAPVAAGISLLKGALGLGPSAFYLTFARRYVPAMAYPAVFVFLFVVRRVLKSRKTDWTQILAVGFCFSLIVYLYFFLWTALFGWIVCVVGCGLLLDAKRAKKQLVHIWLPAGAVTLALCAPYFYLLTQRHAASDNYLILERTREILLLRPTLVLGVGLLFAALALIKLGRLRLKRHAAVFVFSILILPVFVFNQQIFTGRSLQPHHYDMYALNYLILTAFVLLIYFLFRRGLRKIHPVWWAGFAVLVFGWGVMEMNYAAGNRLWYNVARDESVPVSRRLGQIAREDFSRAKSQMTLNFDSVQGNNQPTVAPHGVLWSEHMFFMANMTDAEHRRRYFAYLYYLNRDEKWLAANLRPCAGEACRALFGWATIKSLSIDHYVPPEAEINRTIEEYAQFVEKFGAADAANPALSYVVAPAGAADFSRLDMWYERDAGERHGKFVLYRVKIKTD